MTLKKIDWNTIYQKQSPKLLGLCQRYVKDTELAEDLLHDAFLTAIDKIDTFKNKGSFNGWLKKIVVNTVLLHLRKEKKLEMLSYDENILQANNQPESTFNKRYIIAQANFTKVEIAECLEKLPEHHKVVFNLYVFEGYKHSQISKILEISVGTSKSWLSRARKKLVELLYSKAAEQVNEETKKRKVLAAFWFFSVDGRFVDNFYKRGLKSLKVIPNRALNFTSAKENALVTKSFLIQAVSLTTLVLIIGIGIATTNASNKKNEEEIKKNCNSSLVFMSYGIFSEFGDTQVGEIKKEFGGVQDKGNFRAMQDHDTKMPQSPKPENLIAGKDTSKSEKSMGNIQARPVIKNVYEIDNLGALYSYYYLSSNADSEIIGNDKIIFYKETKNADAPVLQFFPDSNYCFKYNREVDTISVLEPNNRIMLNKIVEKKADEFCGKGWLRSGAQYANFIVQDSLRLQYRIYLRGSGMVLFVKEATYNLNQNNRPVGGSYGIIEIQKAK